MVQVFFQCETPFHSYRRCAVHPDDHALLIGRHLLVDVDALLQEDQHGRRSHEGEHRVQDEAKHVQLWKWQQKKMRRVIILEWSTQRQKKGGGWHLIHSFCRKVLHRHVSSLTQRMEMKNYAGR